MSYSTKWLQRLLTGVVLLLHVVGATVVSTVSRSTTYVSDITADGTGSLLYVAASLNAVYRLAPDGSIVLLAGSGTSDKRNWIRCAV